MAKPQSRGQLINFGLRKLGYPVLEINLDTDQIHDALDDTLQLYQEPVSYTHLTLPTIYSV